MNIKEALILLFTHGIPILFFMYMATDVWLRNKFKTEHILLGLISLCYLLLFAEEYVRAQVPIEYSSKLSSLWLSSIGIIIPGLCSHFLVKFTQLDSHMPRYIYPYVFYLPLLFVAINVVTGADLIAAQTFIESGMWKLPEYNTGYYIAMSSSIGVDLLFFIPLLIAKKKASTQEQMSIYNLLLIGVVVSIIWHIVFGFINYNDNLPPYPYLYSGMVWCYFLRFTMKKYDFLNLYENRYEKLFNMNPDAIVLIDRNGVLKNANPGAARLFTSMKLQFESFYELLDPDIKARIRERQEISLYETEIMLGNRRLVLQVDADYVWADNELHVLLIVRDITVQKDYQEEITLLAYHDPLTRLPNRRYFNELLDEALQEAEHKQETVALLLIDLDKIKLLNDTRGHLAGDEALKQAAHILQETVAELGIVARMGGDEFVLFVKNSPTKHEIELMLDQMQRKFSQFTERFGNLPIGMSIGVSYFPSDGTDGQALINVADNAMFEMKRSRA
ncbi:MAG: sensor domain-containing diguanylate cyclase [Candidatus Cohnella colombiensis]|uniref:Sensor domain-containing diguanylate cyclase n=1 Tax=Candidatus Cohnella colombiensis TaxID=3121368 RepID=A0AA95EW74_9BACL|nr:MAG: sensor domain-containing diguanylate cyclase [Cohnella sp.]